MTKPYEKQTYFALALDPVHVGTGGYRLGRVDNTITREPGTNLPKVPGSSIAGVTRAYTAMAIQAKIAESEWTVSTDGMLRIKSDVYKKMKYQRPKYDFLDIEKGLIKPDTKNEPLICRNSKGGIDEPIYLSCAGKGAQGGDAHCGEADCEVCTAFGFSRKSGTSFQGLAQFSDARILFFPVHSMIGPVWITSPCILKEHRVNAVIDDEEKFRPFVADLAADKLNFGWLMLQKEPGEVPFDDNFTSVPDEIRKRVVLVSDKLFSRIVNDNLEVRTSVAIDPATGAADPGALYTYEAIPRTTVMWFDVVYNKPEYFKISSNRDINPDQKNGEKWEWIKTNVEKGLRLAEHLGIGGMNTRGMGRLKVLNLPEVTQ